MPDLKMIPDRFYRESLVSDVAPVRGRERAELTRMI